MPEEKRNCRIVSIADDAVMTASSVRLDPARSYRASVWQPDRNPLVWPDQEEIKSGSIAFYPVYGDIAWSSWWRFSTEEFISALRSADANPAISGHLIRVDSAGGEVFGCHEAFETVRDLSKPCIAVVDSICASAAYWLVCAADRIYATSIFSETGSIGVMGILVDDEERMLKNGYRRVVCYSTLSDLKNKPERDAIAGHPDEFVRRMIDPVAEQFIADVKAARGLADDSEALRGRLYFAADAFPAQLIDGQESLEEAVDILIGMFPEPEPASVDMIDINQININI